MSSAGIYAERRQGGQLVGHCLIVGEGVPRIHHSDGLPVYLVVEHKLGMPQVLKDGRTRKHLLAYPSAWPGPGGRHVDVFIFADHEYLTWSAPVPIFDIAEPGT